ncbi:MAG TPA: DUF222 domain-containing protein, partial [Acidimicrobiales bacterium]|nr:DUF222 domain-containing protein [Acidimicrobiales bacterium]HUQ40343.1 DUF222 domain-containing protein [Acidimicrobiales bacterium]
MFDVLEAEIEGLRIPVDGAALRKAHRLLDRFAAKVSEADGEFDAAGMWEPEGATSMANWLRYEARQSGGKAASDAKIAEALRSLPVTAVAWRSGELSGAQVQAIVANVPRRHRELFASH